MTGRGSLEQLSRRGRQEGDALRLGHVARTRAHVVLGIVVRAGNVELRVTVPTAALVIGTDEQPGVLARVPRQVPGEVLGRVRLVVVVVEVERHRYLLEVVEADGLFRHRPAASERRIGHRDQRRQNDDHHQHFDERETSSGGHSGLHCAAPVVLTVFCSVFSRAVALCAISMPKRSASFPSLAFAATAARRVQAVSVGVAMRSGAGATSRGMDSVLHGPPGAAGSCFPSAVGPACDSDRRTRVGPWS